MQTLNEPISIKSAQALSPLQLAFIGDAVYTLMSRTELLSTHDYRPSQLHTAAAKIVNAVSQNAAYKKIALVLTEEEAAIFKRGRNAHSKHAAPKSASPEDYKNATGLEAVYGYLYLTGQIDRLEQLYALCTQQEE